MSMTGVGSQQHRTPPTGGAASRNSERQSSSAMFSGFTFVPDDGNPLSSVVSRGAERDLLLDATIERGERGEDDVSSDDVLTAMKIATEALVRCENPEERIHLEEEIASYKQALESLAADCDDQLFGDFEGSF